MYMPTSRPDDEYVKFVSADGSRKEGFQLTTAPLLGCHAWDSALVRASRGVAFGPLSFNVSKARCGARPRKVAITAVVQKAPARGDRIAGCGLPALRAPSVDRGGSLHKVPIAYITHITRPKNSQP